jgi:hypothetical protein
MAPNPFAKCCTVYYLEPSFHNKSHKIYKNLPLRRLKAYIDWVQYERSTICIAHNKLEFNPLRTDGDFCHRGQDTEIAEEI